MSLFLFLGGSNAGPSFFNPHFQVSEPQTTFQPCRFQNSIPVGGKCLWFGQFETTWNQANSHCQKQDMKLLEITPPNVYFELGSLIKHKSEFFFSTFRLVYVVKGGWTE